eukprot:m.732385 g.732385  ORF g.732385 m.732385 type:complete len:113 (+) comp23067_c0_seq54:97-435(+)
MEPGGTSSTAVSSVLLHGESLFIIATYLGDELVVAEERIPFRQVQDRANDVDVRWSHTPGRELRQEIKPDSFAERYDKRIIVFIVVSCTNGVIVRTKNSAECCPPERALQRV